MPNASNGNTLKTKRLNIVYFCNCVRNADTIAKD